MSKKPNEEVVKIIEDASFEFYRKLAALNLSEHHMASAYASLIRILMDTVAQNTNPLVAVKLVIIVMQRFTENHPGLNVLVHEQITPPKEKMQ